MKALRGLKKQKTIKILDLQKVAQQKLAIFSDEPFVNLEDNFQDPWASSSFNATTPLFRNDYMSPKKSPAQKLKNNKPEAFQKTFKIIKPVNSEEHSQNKSLNKYFGFDFDDQKDQTKTKDGIFPQKKSLSLTNYIMLDKRKSNFFEDKSVRLKYQLQRLKMMHLKKAILSRRNKKKQSSPEKRNSIEEKQLKTGYKLRFSSYSNHSPLKNRQSSLDRSQKINRSIEKSENQLETQILKESLVRKKQLSNPNLWKNRKNYEFAKQILEKQKQIGSWVNSTKLKLHSYYKKYTY